MGVNEVDFMLRPLKVRYSLSRARASTSKTLRTTPKQIYMLTAHLPRINTIKDEDMLKLLELFKVEKYRRDFLNL